MAQSSTQPKMVCWLLSTFKACVDLVNLVSEDCLTLDVMVPKKVWDNRDSRTPFKGTPGALALDAVLTCAS